jgi:hypothetical protein
MEIIVSKYKKVTDFCYELFNIAELPLHFSKYSNKIYSTYQKLFLLVYKQFRKFTYEELLTDIADNISLREYLGLVKIPDFTTLIKFAKKLPLELLERLMSAFQKLIPDPKRVAIDATGISLDNASSHYCKRIGKPYKKRPFLKTTFFVDIDNYIILLHKSRRNNRHDTIDAKILFKKLSKKFNPKTIYGDRGYDDEQIFEFIDETLKAEPLILQRRIDIQNHRRKGHYRRKHFKTFDYCEYSQRNKIETTNSMFKRRFGSSAKSRGAKRQKLEVFFRVIAYNIDRLIRLGHEVILIFIRITRVSY